MFRVLPSIYSPAALIQVDVEQTLPPLFAAWSRSRYYPSQPLALSRHRQQLRFEPRNLHVEILETWGLARVSKPILIHIYVKIFIFIKKKKKKIQ